ncbi:MAG: hypothetical protein D6744_05125 [Planctomycetota bacterium]|nr:MAG: hypothetical protein D6744_05125 [Planctomycetota bacterium]
MSSRREEKLALLRRACREAPHAEMMLRDGPRVTTSISLVCAEPDGLLVRIQPAVADAYAEAGRWVRIEFDLSGNRYCLAARTIAPIGLDDATGRYRGLHLSLPLRIDQRTARRRLRLRFAGGGSLQADFTSIPDPQKSFRGRVRDISSAGLGVIAAAEDCARIRRDEPYWVSIDLPAQGAIDFAARCVHQRTTPGGESIQGWTFQAGDEPGFIDRILARLSRVAAETEEVLH